MVRFEGELTWGGALAHTAAAFGRRSSAYSPQGHAEAKSRIVSELFTYGSECGRIELGLTDSSADIAGSACQPIA
jgi:hypothetical protein